MWPHWQRPGWRSPCSMPAGRHCEPHFSTCRLRRACGSKKSMNGSPPSLARLAASSLIRGRKVSQTLEACLLNMRKRVSGVVAVRITIAIPILRITYTVADVRRWLQKSPSVRPGRTSIFRSTASVGRARPTAWEAPSPPVSRFYGPHLRVSLRYCFPQLRSAWSPSPEVGWNRWVPTGHAAS